MSTFAQRTKEALPEDLRRRVRQVRRTRDRLSSRIRHFLRRFRDPWDPTKRVVEPDLLETALVSDQLLARLDSADIHAIEAAATRTERQLLATASAQDRKRLTLALGVHHDVPAVLEKSGLMRIAPPDDVHAMARGLLTAGGDYYYADLVADAFARAGLDLRSEVRVLDFGCSSGRVVRPLAAAYQEVDWHACDPREDAIRWATANLPSISFRVSPQNPPLPYPDSSFDAVFAVSVWSHFAEDAALRWLKEMVRVIKPRGLLLLTTQGWQTIVHEGGVGRRLPEQLSEICRTLHELGFWYVAEFGDRGDDGIVNPQWGSAFLSPEWLLAQACPPWSVSVFAPGRVEGNQDLWVLRRS